MSNKFKSFATFLKENMDSVPTNNSNTVFNSKVLPQEQVTKLYQDIKANAEKHKGYALLNAAQPTNQFWFLMTETAEQQTDNIQTLQPWSILADDANPLVYTVDNTDNLVTIYTDPNGNVTGSEDVNHGMKPAIQAQELGMFNSIITGYIPLDFVTEILIPAFPGLKEALVFQCNHMASIEGYVPQGQTEQVAFSTEDKGNAKTILEALGADEQQEQPVDQTQPQAIANPAQAAPATQQPPATQQLPANPQ